MKKFSNIRWITNIAAPAVEKLELVKTYSPDKYQEFDNCSAINVRRTADIPKNYTGIMGVPVSALDYLDYDRFEIVAADFERADPVRLSDGRLMSGRCYLNGKRLFSRILIRLKK